MKKLLFLALSILLMASCDSPERRIKDLSKQFMDEHMVNTDRSNVVFGPVDSTASINAARIATMRKQAESNDDFKKDISYNNGSKVTPTLLYVSVNYDLTDKSGKVKKCRQIFYTDKEATNIVAFMNN